VYVEREDVKWADIPTFESHWTAHEACPNISVFYSDDFGWCTLHDEWWELPDQDEVLGA